MMDRTVFKNIFFLVPLYFVTFLAHLQLEAAAAQSIPSQPRPVLSLIVSGNDVVHLREHLRQLSNLHQKRGIAIGNVAIIGMGHLIQYREQLTAAKTTHNIQSAKTQLDAARASLGPFFTYLEQAEVPLFSIRQSQGILQRLQISSSPTWVVRHKGRDYVFEGFSDPSVLFDRKGNFTSE